MCNFGCSIATLVSGAVLVALSSIVGYTVVPNIIDNMVINEVVLEENTLQFERFEEIPFPLNFTIRIFNISNPDDVVNGGVPRVQECGPYTYKLYTRRVVESIEDDVIKYRFLYNYEFDPVASYPNTEDDVLTIVNAPYHAILQVAEQLISPAIMILLNQNLNNVFGVLNSPFANIRVGDLIFDGLPVCQNPGFIGNIICNIIRDLGDDTPNLAIGEDGSVVFSLFAHKNNKLSELYEVYRGVEDHSRLGILREWNEAPSLPHWMGQESTCNMLNGTDTNIFPPFVDRSQPIYGFNTDICRSVELRYQYDTEYQGIPVARYAVNEWFLDNDEGCFCLNVTTGLSRPDGCLKRGAQELYSCVEFKVQREAVVSK